MLRFDDTYMDLNLIGLNSFVGYSICNYCINNTCHHLNLYIFFKEFFSYSFIISFIFMLSLFLFEYVILPYLKK